MERKAAPHMMLQIQPSRKRKVRKNCTSATPLLVHTTLLLVAPFGRTWLPHSTVRPDTKVPETQGGGLCYGLVTHTEFFLLWYL